MVNNTTNINKPNNHLSSQIIEQTQKYHQYQQTKQSPLISNHWTSTKIPPISTNQTITSHLKSLNKHKNTTNINKLNNHLSSQIIEQTHKKYHNIWHWKSKSWFVRVRFCVTSVYCHLHQFFNYFMTTTLYGGGTNIGKIPSICRGVWKL
jgi:hypothetical protein